MGRMRRDADVPRVRRAFTEEFKAGAVRLVLDEGKTIARSRGIWAWPPMAGAGGCP
jgi:transposase-like protein